MIRLNCNRCDYQGKTKLNLISHKRHKHWGKASKNVSIPSDPVLSEFDLTTKMEIFSDQIEVKHEFDNFIFEEANQGRNDEEYSEHEDDHISDHVETDFNSNLEIELEPPQDDLVTFGIKGGN